MLQMPIEILDELGQPGSLYFIAQTGSDGSANYSQVNSVTGDASKDYQLNKTIEELQADGSIVLSGNDVKKCPGSDNRRPADKE